MLLYTFIVVGTRSQGTYLHRKGVPPPQRGYYGGQKYRIPRGIQLYCSL